MEFRYTKNARLLLLTILGAFCASISYLTYVYKPAKWITKEVTKFDPNSILYSLWKRPPLEALIKISVFNVTNAEEFLEGTDKLRFTEVGPYVYKEILYNNNSTFNENGTITFIPKREIKFVPEYSINDESLDTFILPNIPLLGIAAALNDESIFVKLGISSISAYLGSESFINITVSDLLNGYDDQLVNLANDFVPNWIDFTRFSIFDLIMRNDNASNIVTMNVNPAGHMSNNLLLTPEEKLRPFSIQKWNGSPGLQQWGYEIEENNETSPHNSRCNLVEGAFMGTLFPQDMDRNISFSLYRKAFCRTIPVEYEDTKITKDGFEGYMYRVKQDFLSTPEENIDNTCYCSKKCIYKGLGDISPCFYSIPVSVSQPHFLNADPFLLEQVGGMSPNKEKHDTTIVIHPQLGLPIEVNVRLQINLVMPETQYNSKTKPFNNLVIPLLWIEMNVDDMPSDIKFYLIFLYSVLPILEQVVIYGLAVAGLALIFGSALIIFLYSDYLSPQPKSLHINYNQIPVFSLKRKIFKPDILVQK